MIRKYNLPRRTPKEIKECIALLDREALLGDIDIYSGTEATFFSRPGNDKYEKIVRVETEGRTVRLHEAMIRVLNSQGEEVVELTIDGEDKADLERAAEEFGLRTEEKKNREGIDLILNGQKLYNLGEGYYGVPMQEYQA